MNLVGYRTLYPHRMPVPKSHIYRRLGITESFIRNIDYSGPLELAKAVCSRERVGMGFATALRNRLMVSGFHDFITEERAKRIRRVAEKLVRQDRETDVLPTFAKELLKAIHVRFGISPIGSIRDWYGVRIIHGRMCGQATRNADDDFLEPVLGAAGVKDVTQILHLYDRNQFAYSYPDTPYRALHVSFVYEGVPMEVQIRSEANDMLAKTIVKRPGLD